MTYELKHPIMNTTKKNLFAIMLTILLCLPLLGFAQKKAYIMVLETTDSEKKEFCITKTFPYIWCQLYSGGNAFIVMRGGTTKISLDDIKSIYTIERIISNGDITCDGNVNVQDVTNIVNYILDNIYNYSYNYIESFGYVYSAADMNNDDEIDVFDVTAMINVILSGNRNSALSRSQRLQEESTESIYLTASNNGILFDIDNAERFTSFQFDVEVPQGVDLMGVEWNGSSHHTLQYAKTGENRYTVIALSMNNEPLHDKTNGMLRLRLSGAASGKVSADNVLFVTPQGKAAHFRGQTIGTNTASR